ncbi:hypothetical protein Ddc_06354 [Ditylenchus destructor]|nr:hypothetical protein Ddc_06354 [Ditylenchus destructor]
MVLRVVLGVVGGLSQAVSPNKKHTILYATQRRAWDYRPAALAEVPAEGLIKKIGGRFCAFFAGNVKAASGEGRWVDIAGWHQHKK